MRKRSFNPLPSLPRKERAAVKSDICICPSTAACSSWLPSEAWMWQLEPYLSRLAEGLDCCPSCCPHSGGRRWKTEQLPAKRQSGRWSHCTGVSSSRYGEKSRATCGRREENQREGEYLRQTLRDKLTIKRAGT